MHRGQLFSDYFLNEGIRNTAAYQRLADGELSFASDLQQRLERIFAEFPFQGSPDEAQTEDDLICRVLEALGWDRDAWLSQPRAARKGRSDVPDILLFPNADAKRRANAETEKDRRFRHGVAVVESKRWDRPLDRAVKGTSKGDDEREVPSSQILRYLSRAETASDRGIQWGILTNGRVWRLYYQGAKSRSEEYLEIDLSYLLDVDGLAHLFTERDEAERAHWLRVFALVFGRAAFVDLVDGQRTFHFLALDEGRMWEARVTRNLSNLVFVQLFPDLIKQLDTANPHRPAAYTLEYRIELKEAALTLLYRLLFVLYAEDRDLLPVRDRRYDDYGLSAIRNEIARRIDGKDALAATIGHYYGHLRGLFRAIDKGEPSLGLPPYNGGLFDPRAAPLLERVDLPDAAFAPLLDALSRHGGKRINYRDLSVQQLGSIYERLLEHDVVERNGTIEVVADEAARKGSGSFYTHEVLVQFILERTVGPLVTERVERFRARVKELAGQHSPKAERLAQLAALDPASQLLDIKVCDPAMGSGHFLVSLVDLLADRVLEQIADAPAAVDFADAEHPYESPLVERIAAIRTRILSLAQRNRWKLDEAQLDDKHIVRRMILKRVVHGVDKNPMAVELAKVSLWLHTFTAGAPLSFLNHHLREGDSLLGMRVADANKWLQERGALTIHRHVAQAQNAAAGMAHVESITDSDIADVEESARTFDGIREATEPLSAFLSLIAAERLMGVFDAAPKEQPKESRRTKNHEAKVAAHERARAFENVLDGNLGDPIAIAREGLNIPAEGSGENAELFPSDRAEQASLFSGSSLDPRHVHLAHDLVEEAQSLARRHRFLHWELAFPNVWQNWLSPEPRGGFDAVIGNPPYVRQEQIKHLKPALKKAYRAYDGMADLYVYFYELGLRLLRPGGRLSYVVTNKWLRAGYAEELRDLLSSEGWLEAVTDFGHAKKFFPGADVFPCVIVARRPDGSDSPYTTEVCQISRDVVRLDRVSQQVRDMGFPLPRASFTRHGWQLDPPEVAALMDKIRRSGIPLHEYSGVSPHYGIKTGYNEAFLIETSTREALVADDPKCDEIIKPYLRGQDIERWAPRWRGLWMIMMQSSSDYAWPWADADTQAEHIFAGTFPSLFVHLQKHRNKLQNREDQGRFWWEMRPCTYWNLLNGEKLIYNDITWHLEFTLDRSGYLINNTVYFLPTQDRWLLATLNAPVGWWFAWRSAQHGKDEALRYFTSFVERYPVPYPREAANEAAAMLIDRLSSIQQEKEEAGRELLEWYRVALEIGRPASVLRDPFALTSDDFVEQVRRARGRRKPMSSALIQVVREEYDATVRPTQVAHREADRLERRLSEMVNEAYGLTPDEVRLMWNTAPRRMPLMPAAEDHHQAAVEAVA